MMVPKDRKVTYGRHRFVMQGAQQGEARAKLLRDLPGALIAVSQIDDLLRLTARSVMDALDYEDCVIYLRADDGKYEQRAAWGPKSVDGIVIENPLRLHPDEGIVGAAGTSQMAQIVVDAVADPRYVSDVVPGGSEMAVPIVFGGQTLGVIDSEHSDIGFYSREDAETVTAIASIVAAMLQAVMTSEQLTGTVAELNRAQHELKVAARTDLLTGVGNRRHLHDVLHAAAHGPQPYGVAVIGVDGLKRINRRHGYRRADHVLEAVAGVLVDACRPLGVTLCRGASDEFFIVGTLPQTDFARRITAMLERLRHQPHVGLDANERMTSTAGLAYGHGVSILTDAVDALAVGKKHGGNQLWIYREDDIDIISLRDDRSWSPRIDRALRSNELCLVAQAIADGTTNQVEFYEVLLRHRSSHGVLSTPLDLLDAANRLGRGPSVDRWVTAKVVDTLLSTDPSVRLGVNWTVDSLTSSEMVNQLITALDQARVDPARLIVEVTEHACIEAPVEFASSVARLRSNGVRIALDDLGAGWTSLRTLEQTPVDYIKLDGDWVRSAQDHELAFIAVRSMIECAKALDICVVAEWVENDRIRRLVRDLGASFVQGYGIQRPQPMADLFGQTKPLGSSTS